MNNDLRLRKRVLTAPQFILDQWREDEVDGLKNSAYLIYSILRTHIMGNPGRNVFDEDWDVLLILDACRVDLMERVVSDYEFLPSDIPEWTSIGSKSSEWMDRTFVEEYRKEIEETAYITGNPYSAKRDFEVEPGTTIEVWQFAWDDELHTIPPRPITDVALRTWAENDHERMIVHYMQPHGPFINYPNLGEYGGPEDFGNKFENLWDIVGDEIPLQEFWEAYEDNLRVVLEDVELVLNNLGASDVVITADHGNAVGEWGIYGHPDENLHPTIRQVPWIETTATDEGGYSPGFEIDMEAETAEKEINDRLKALGYKE